MYNIKYIAVAIKNNSKNTAESGLDININDCNDNENIDDDINGGIGTSEPLINSELSLVLDINDNENIDDDINGGIGASEPLNSELSLTPINPDKSQIDDMVENIFVFLHDAPICMYLYVLSNYFHI